LAPVNSIRNPSVLTFGGVDSCGGAGVAADLKTFAALKIHGACVITALTAQNTEGVKAILPVESGFVRKQVEAVLNDLQIKYVKSGMLYTKENVKVVAETVEKYNLKIVVDPVFKSGVGNSLTMENVKSSYINELLPITYVLTPNIFEAEELSELKIRDLKDVKRAAVKISKFGVKNIIIKGGHLESGPVLDVFYHDGRFIFHKKPRVGVTPHGGGCSFSAALTANLAKGLDLRKAFLESEHLMEEIFHFSLKIGKGREAINPTSQLHNEAERYNVIKTLSLAVKKIEENEKFLPFIAEVGTQIGMALPYASTSEHVAAVEGRIVKGIGKAKVAGPIKFGVSKHIAAVILTCMQFDANFRSAMNLHYSEDLVNAFRKKKLTVSSFSREDEPKKIKKIEGKTLVWGVSQAIKKVGRIPDVIYDLGEVGKEPMIRILGRDALEVVKKAVIGINDL
jgi:hydroxymethylpyrimidine/phosphomethylpyrimidine kinase